MQKLLSKLLVFLIILKIISPIAFIGQVFAVSNTWDFDNIADYSLSDVDINHIKIENSLVRLPYHLEHLGAIQDNTNLDGARRVIVKGNYAFISSYDADMLVSLDISDPSSPIIVDTIANGDQGINLDAPVGLTFTGNYLYVAGYRSDNVNIIDISNPTNMAFVKEISDSSWNQQLNGAKDVKIFGNYLYVASYVDDAFNIFDNSDPSNPSYKKNLKDSTKLDGINRINIDGNYAYVAVNRNDSFAIIDLTNQDSQFQNISIVGEVNDGDNGALLDGARGVSFSGNLAYIASNVSDAMEIIDITDKTAPVHTGSIINGGDIKLNANRQVVLYNGYAFNSARSSDAIEVVDISDSTNPTHESQISKVAGTILLDGANDIYNSGSLFYVAGNIDDSLEILKAKYSSNNPYVIPNNPYNYTGSITSFTEVLGTNNEGNITYQISRDSGNTWYYFDGNSWQITSTGVNESNTALVINSNLKSFNDINDSGTGSFLFKAFLTSDGTQKVELDSVNITTVESPTDISNPVFWYDGQDTDGDGDSTNEPNSGAELTPLIDKFNGFNSYNNTSGEIPLYDTGLINGHPNLSFDGNNDHYIIDNQTLINTASSYYEKSFSIVFKTGDDITTFQNVYEQGGTARGYVIQIENNHLYAGVFNNVEWNSGDQYKFVDLGLIKTNEVYYLTMVQESTNSKTLKVYLDSHLIGDLSNVDYQRSHGGAIGLGFVNGNIVKSTDNSSTSGPDYFKGQIGEFLSWNHALTDKEIQGVDAYLKNKWDLIFRIYPIILDSSISDNEVFSTGTFDFNFTFKDGENGPGIDTSTADIELYKWDSTSSSWRGDISGTGVIEDSITTSTGYYHTNSLGVGDYKIVFNIANIDGNFTSKEVLFTIDLTGTPGKIFNFDAQNIDGDFDDSNEPNSGDNIVTWVDIKKGYNAYQNTSGNQAVYEINTINSHPSIKFDGIDDFYGIDNQVDINTASSYDVKSFSMILKTGDDVNIFQDLYEQGGGTRGYSIQMESGHLYMGAWNNAEWDTGNQYKFVDLGVINTNEIYNILLVQDSTAGTDTGNTIKAYIDGSLVGTLDHVDIQRSHPGDIVIGKNNDGRKYDGSSIGNGYYFKGYIGEFISWNYSLTGSTIDNLNEYLRERWDLDKVAPIISGTNIASGTILAGGNNSLEFYYSDSSEYGTGVGININSGNIILERWDSGSSSWIDVSNKIGTGVLTQTGASYQSLDLDYGKYRVSFNISDYNGNISDYYVNIFYVDRPQLIISTGSINIGKLNDTTNTFGDTLTVTVKTIGAPFKVKLQKNQELTHSNGNDFIPYYDGSIGMGYDKNNDGNLSDYNDDIILSDSGTLNTNGDLNTYTYTLKMGAIIEQLQAGGDYTGKINFNIELDY